ncbi:TetR/AcrR family transcriptional regulator, partial [Tsukamurella strandjordii]
MSRRVGRPSTPQIDRASIGAAALELIDRDGGFTMPALARRLGVQVSSIYHHVDGRGAVVELVREAVTKDVDGAWFDTLPWDEAVEAWARGYRAA